MNSAPDLEILGNLGLIIGGGFDTTTALTAHSLEWLGEHPANVSCVPRTRHAAQPRDRVPALLHPAPGDGRTSPGRHTSSTAIQFKEGERLWISWAMATGTRRCSRPEQVILDRQGNRHFSFGLGRAGCADPTWRTVFKSM